MRDSRTIIVVNKVLQNIRAIQKKKKLIIEKAGLSVPVRQQ